ncbi:hypothetical protein D3C76_399580 [compost metagenome]
MQALDQGLVYTEEFLQKCRYFTLIERKHMFCHQKDALLQQFELIEPFDHIKDVFLQELPDDPYLMSLYLLTLYLLSLYLMTLCLMTLFRYPLHPL